MELLFAIVKDYSRVDDLLLGFLELGVTGASAFDARGMGQIIGTEVPIFADLRGLFPGSARDSTVIFAAIPSALATPCLDMVERVVGPLEQPGTGIAFTLPIGQIRGLKPEIH